MADNRWKLCVCDVNYEDVWELLSVPLPLCFQWSVSCKVSKGKCGDVKSWEKHSFILFLYFNQQPSFLGAVLGLEWNLMEVQSSPNTASPPLPCLSSLLISISGWYICDWYIIRNYKYITYIRALSLCYPFCGFGQICNDMFPPLQYHPEQFHYSKNPL